jgi:hypothetical protein
VRKRASSPISLNEPKLGRAKPQAKAKERRSNMIKPMKLTFDVEGPSELAAGINGFTDKVTVVVESGDPGGEPGEFQDFIRQALIEWYDTAGVGLREEQETMSQDEIIDFAEKLAKKFVGKVESNRARSVETYAKCKQLLAMIAKSKEEANAAWQRDDPKGFLDWP